LFSNRRTEMTKHSDHVVIGRIQRFVVGKKNFDQEEKHDRSANQAAGNGKQKCQPQPKAGEPCEQISDSSEPRQERRQCREVERRNLRRTGMPAGMGVPMSDVQMSMMRVRHVKKAAHHGKQAQRKTNNETDEIQNRPGHMVCSFKTCRSRSASPGVSRIAASRMKHFLESS